MTCSLIIKHAGALIGAFGLCVAGTVSAIPVTFDFDTGSPPLYRGQSIPAVQTVGGVTAHFSSPGYMGFSFQDDGSTFYHMSVFSGLYLWPNSINQDRLNIAFDQPILTISIVFATIDYQDNAEIPSDVRIYAYDNGTLVGTATTHANYLGDTYPTGTISFSNTQPFNFIDFGIVPGQPQGTPGFMADNIIVNPAPVNDVPAGWLTTAGPLSIAPNPSDGAVGVTFDLASPSTVHIAVYDVTGRLVRDLLSEPMLAGRHSVDWDGLDDHGVAIRSGLYLVRIDRPGVHQVGRAVILHPATR
jgi:hypothetical protein